MASPAHKQPPPSQRTAKGRATFRLSPACKRQPLSPPRTPPASSSTPPPPAPPPRPRNNIPSAFESPDPPAATPAAAESAPKRQGLRPSKSAYAAAGDEKRCPNPASHPQSTTQKETAPYRKTPP